MANLRANKIVSTTGSNAITGSVEFDGTGDYLSLAYNSNLWLGSSNWTIECWIHPNSFSNYGIIWDHGYGFADNTRSIVVYINQSNGILRIAQSPDGGTNYDTSLGISLTTNSWHHLAIVRNGSSVTGYLNGIAGTSVTAYDLYNSTTRSHSIGLQGDLQAITAYNGFISNLRILKGTALYTSNFIPPTRELKNIPGTVLLCCQDSKSATQEATGKTITVNGNATARNFSPQVGFDGYVEFLGPTKINTENYFYLPTGPTEQRGRGRGLFGGGEAPTSPNTTNIIDYITIATTGNAQDFGDLTQARRKLTSFSSSTRGIFGDGGSPGATDIIDYVTIATTGNALDFGDTTQDCVQSGGCSNQIRGLFGGGYNVAPTVTGLIQYVTIATKGDTISFGDLTQERFDVAGCASPTRGIFGGGKNTPISENFDIIDYVTIMSTGNAVDFGNLTVGRRNPVSCSSTVRGLFAGGFATPLFKNEIDYITIASTGNAQDFGDLTVAKQEMNAGLSDNVRGVFGGGQVPSAPIRLNSIDYVTIASTGNAQDFGDLTGERNSSGSASDSHGGLG